MITKLDKENFDKNISKGLKIVEFFAPWCGHCQNQTTVLAEMDKIWIGEVNSENSPELLKKFSIRSFPTFVLFKDGKEIERFSGFHTKFELMDVLMKYLK